jgi:hypothetical protein
MAAELPETPAGSETPAAPAPGPAAPGAADPASPASPPPVPPAGATPPSGGPAAEQAEVVRLLIKAVGTLPDAERDRVYAWFLERGITGSQGAPFATAPLPRQLREITSMALSLQAGSGRPGAQSIGQQVVPVRFAADQHAALRTWCSEHGFSMATVIRGLVSRFLEGQLPARN